MEYLKSLFSSQQVICWNSGVMAQYTVSLIKNRGFEESKTPPEI